MNHLFNNRRKSAANRCDLIFNRTSAWNFWTPRSIALYKSWSLQSLIGLGVNCQWRLAQDPEGERACALWIKRGWYSLSVFCVKFHSRWIFLLWWIIPPMLRSVINKNENKDSWRITSQGEYRRRISCVEEILKKKIFGRNESLWLVHFFFNLRNF